MDQDPRRAELDRASFYPRGYAKKTWEARAMELAAPAWELVDEVVGSWDFSGLKESAEFISSLAAGPGSGLPPLPQAGYKAWESALEQLIFLPLDKQSSLAKTLGKLLRGEPHLGVRLPLLLALLENGLSQRRESWLEGLDLGVEVAVACLLNPRARKLREGAFGQLCQLRAGVPVPVRGALWLAIWDSDRIPATISSRQWIALGRLLEPAAVAGTLSWAFWGSIESLAPRPATTRALARIIARKDPWLEQNWSSEQEPQRGEKVLAKALDLLPWAALAFGGRRFAIDVLTEQAAVTGLPGAIAQGLLGELDGLGPLVQALGEPSPPDDVFWALAALGPSATTATEALRRCPDPSAVVALAAISPGSEDNLLPIVLDDLQLLPQRNEQFNDGLITPHEIARWWWRIATIRHLWRARGPLTPAQQEALDSVNALLAASPDLSGFPWLAPLYEPLSERVTGDG